MKKLSLVLAFVGLISATSFASTPTHPQDATKKQSTEKTTKHKHAKKDSAKKGEAKPKAASTTKAK
ncbi:MAG: hypothetical protein ACXVPU_03290 [Bacteroidia bacterium]